MRFSPCPALGTGQAGGMFQLENCLKKRDSNYLSIFFHIKGTQLQWLATVSVKMGQLANVSLL